MFPPKGPIGSTSVKDQLLSWTSVHGWHDIARRLIDAGTTDYSAYAAIDRGMLAVPGTQCRFSLCLCSACAAIDGGMVAVPGTHCRSSSSMCSSCAAIGRGIIAFPAVQCCAVMHVSNSLLALIFATRSGCLSFPFMLPLAHHLCCNSGWLAEPKFSRPKQSVPLLVGDTHMQIS